MPDEPTEFVKDFNDLCRLLSRITEIYTKILQTTDVNQLASLQNELTQIMKELDTIRTKFSLPSQNP